MLSPPIETLKIKNQIVNIFHLIFNILYLILISDNLFQTIKKVFKFDGKFTFKA